MNFIMKMMEPMMGKMVRKMSTKEKEEMMNKMMPNMLAGMTSTDKMQMMKKMMPYMMQDMDMKEMPKMMEQMMPDMWEMMDKKGMDCSVMMPKMMPIFMERIMGNKSNDDKKRLANEMIAVFKKWVSWF